MKERPILFSAPMVRAILEGRKTVTRRVFAPERMTWPRKGFYETHALRGGELMTTGFGPFHPERWLSYCPYGQPGDRLWVRESFWKNEDGFKPTLLLGAKATQQAEYDASLNDLDREELRQFQYKRKPSIHMPRWASRITLEVTGVRVERLWEITSEQAIAEGIEGTRPSNQCEMAWRDYAMAKLDPFEWFGRPVDSFHSLWVSINGTDSWNANPWVWAVEFKRIQQAHAEVTAA